MPKFNERLKSLRTSSGLSQKAFADKIEMSKSSINMYERGEREPSLETLEAIADFFNVDMDYLLGKSVIKNRFMYSFQNNVTKSNEPVDNIIPVSAMLPIYGCIPAGLPALAEEHIEGYMPTSVPNPDEYFYLRVNGDSMIGAGIVDGCKVLIHKQSSADDGQIVACRVNGDEATLKRFKHHGSIVLLKPENNAYDDRIIPVEDFENGNAQIIGVVKQIVIDM